MKIFFWEGEVDEAFSRFVLFLRYTETNQVTSFSKSSWFPTYGLELPSSDTLTGCFFFFLGGGYLVGLWTLR